MNQTLCPYSLSNLSDSLINDEHVLPVSLGAPSSFTVKALVSENSRMNVEIDAPTSHDPLLKLLAVSQGVETRSGSVALKVNGFSADLNEQLAVTLSKDDVSVKLKNPVKRAPNGDILSISEFNGEVESLVSNIVSANRRKGKILNIASREQFKSPTVEFKLAGDLNLINRQLIKIAYLMTVRVYGDRGIKSRCGEIFRHALNIKNSDELASYMDNSGVSYLPGELFHEQLMTAKNPGEHVINCAYTDVNGLIVSVELFKVFALTAIFPKDYIDVPNFSGEVVVINARDSSMTATSFEEHLRSRFKGFR